MPGKNKVIIISIIVILFAILLLLNVTNSNISSNFLLNSNDKINVGLIFPLSGKYASIGAPEKEGIVDAFADIGYLIEGHKINLIIEDNKGDIKSTVDSYNFIKSNSNIVFTSLTPMALALNELSKIDKKILMYLSTAETMALENEYAFKNHLSIDKEAKELSKIANGKLGMVYYSGLQGQIFVNEVQKTTGKISESFSFESGNNDFRTIILKLKEANVQTVFFIGYPNDTLLFLKQAKELNFLPKKIGFAASSFPEVVNVIEDVSPKGVDVIIAASFKETDFDYKFGYNFGQLLIYGMEKCSVLGSMVDDPDCLKETMANASLRGKFGQIQTNEFGIVQTQSKLYTIKNKELVLFEVN